jgi:hypothetical protein
MSKKTSRSFLGMLVYPVTRPLQDISRSIQGIKGSVDAARKKLAEKRSDADLAHKYLKAMTPSERFEEVYQLNEWTEDALRDQASSAKCIRLGSLALAALITPILIWIVFTASIFISMICGIGAIILTATSIAQATRFAWWEYQIQHRQLLPIREFIDRKDLFKRVFSL